MRTNRNQTWDKNGNLVKDEVVEYDNTVEVNESAIRDAVRTALATNRDYVALSSPTAAQTAAQVKALSRQNNRMIRLLLGLLDGTD